MVCPEDRSITKNYVDKILQGGLASPDEDVIYRILGKDGYHWISDTTVKVELPGGTFLQCILSDVSRFVAEREQREAELERLLKASEERYEIIRALGTVYQDQCHRLEGPALHARLRLRQIGAVSGEHGAERGIPEFCPE